MSIQVVNLGASCWVAVLVALLAGVSAALVHLRVDSLVRARRRASAAKR